MRESDLHRRTQEAQERAKEIENVKKADPDGWAKMELSAAHEHAISALTSRKLMETNSNYTKLPANEKLNLFRATERSVRKIITNFKTKEEVQDYLEDNGMPELLQEIDSSTYDMYYIKYLAPEE